MIPIIVACTCLATFCSDGACGSANFCGLFLFKIEKPSVLSAVGKKSLGHSSGDNASKTAWHSSCSGLRVAGLPCSSCSSPDKDGVTDCVICLFNSCTCCRSFSTSSIDTILRCTVGDLDLLSRVRFRPVRTFMSLTSMRRTGASFRRVGS